jgi:hypothetical protein
MKKIIFALVINCCCAQAIAEDFLRRVCDDPEQEAYCIVLVEGFLSGYGIGIKMGAGKSEPNPDFKLCQPSGMTSLEVYKAVLPHLDLEIGMADIALFSAARKAFPCQMKQ